MHSQLILSNSLPFWQFNSGHGFGFKFSSVVVLKISVPHNPHNVGQYEAIIGISHWGYMLGEQKSESLLHIKVSHSLPVHEGKPIKNYL